MICDSGTRKRLESVLFVEDEEDIQRVVEMSLERIGNVRVHICGDPLLALGNARETAPDLLLLDYLMPGLDGATLFKRFQADPNLANIPVVFLTAVSAKDEVERLHSLGVAGVLVKPINVRELPSMLFEIWSGLKD